MKKLLTLPFLLLVSIIIFSLLVSASKPGLAIKTNVSNTSTTAVLFPSKPAIENNENIIIKKRLVDALQAYFDKAIDRRQMVGAAVGIVKCDSMIYLGGFGKRNVKQNDTVDEETVFRIGSLSKGFAGVLAGIQVESGLMKWNDKVVDYLPNFKIQGKDRTDKIMLSTILSHSSGVPRHSFTNLVEDGLSLADISGQFGNLKLVGEPGTIYSYQNAIYAFSGEMMAQATKKPYGDLLNEKIFKPLGMFSASSDYATLMSGTNVAVPHQKRFGRWKEKSINQKYYNAIAAGGVNASVTDMAKWMRFLLGHNQEVLSSATLNEVFNPTIVIPGKRKYYQRWKGHISSHYAFGWRIHSFKDDMGSTETIIHHGGTVSNYRSEIAIYPNEDLGICVLFNSPTRMAKNVLPDLRKIVRDIMNTPVEILTEKKPLVL